MDGVGTLRLLDAVKTCGLINSVRFYQASTSELYGKVQEIPQKETTPFYPRSPYGENARPSPARGLASRGGRWLGRRTKGRDLPARRHVQAGSCCHCLWGEIAVSLHPPDKALRRNLLPARFFVLDCVGRAKMMSLVFIPFPSLNSP